MCFYTNILPELGFEHLTIWFDGNFFGVAYPKTMFTSLFIQIHNLFVCDRLIDSRIDVLSSRQGRGMEPDLWSNDYPTNRFCAFIIFYSFVQHCINKLASVCPSKYRDSGPILRESCRKLTYTISKSAILLKSIV